MKTFKLLIFFSFIIFSLSINRFLKKNQKIPSPQCNKHGYYYNGKCFCFSQFEGPQCKQNKIHGWFDSTRNKCNRLIERLNNLLNINVDHYVNDDDEFPRLSHDSIGQFPPSYGKLPDSWIKMHDIQENFQIFGKTISPLQIQQGVLGDCYFLAAIASLANIRNGEIIKDIFQTKKDNPEHIYVTRWLLNGKPQFVAVDEWVPGQMKNPAFARVFKDDAFWGIILEKAWAKILTQYMQAELGHSIYIWECLTGARSNIVYLQQYNVDEMYQFIQDQLVKLYPMTAGSLDQSEFQYKNKGQKMKLLASHMYSVLDTLDIFNPFGEIQQLIKLFDPWNTEIWTTNPWGGKGKNWSKDQKEQYDINPKNGIFYISAQDFYQHFEFIQYSTIHENYAVEWIDVPFQNIEQEFFLEFIYSGNSNQNIYPFYQLPYDKLYEINKCREPITYIHGSFFYINPKNKITFGEDQVPEATIILPQKGLYGVYFKLKKTYNYIKKFTFSVYAPKGSIKFVNQNDTIVQDQAKTCPNGCNGKGRCNTYNAKCMCYYGYNGKDCSEKKTVNCPNNCNGNGKCDDIFGKCICQRGFQGDDCQPCEDRYASCEERVKKNHCKAENKNFKFMKRNCQKSCAKSGAVEFQQCIVQINRRSSRKILKM